MEFLTQYTYKDPLDPDYLLDQTPCDLFDPCPMKSVKDQVEALIAAGIRLDDLRKGIYDLDSDTDIDDVDDLDTGYDTSDPADIVPMMADLDNRIKSKSKKTDKTVKQNDVITSDKPEEPEGASDK